MKNRNIPFIFLYLFFFCISGLHSASITAAPPDFDIQEANHTFDKINLKLSIQNLKIDDLNTAVNTLTELTKKADQCVDETQKKLNTIEILIKQGSETQGDSTQADHKYLENEKKERLDTIAQCRLFSIRANEAIDAYKTTAFELKQEVTLARGEALWDLIKPIQNNPKLLLTNFSAENIPSLVLPSPFSMFLMGSSALILAVISLILLRNSHFTKKHLRFKRIKISYIFILTLCFFSGLFFISTITLRSIADTLSISLGILFAYFTSWISLVFIFKIKPIRRFFYWYSLDYHTFRSFLFFILTTYTCIELGKVVHATMHPPVFFTRIIESVFLILILTVAFYFSLLLSKKHKQHKIIKRNIIIINLLSFLFFLSDACLATFGYLSLSIQLTYAAFMSLTTLFFTILITQGIQKCYGIIKEDPKIKHKICSYFGYKKEETFVEFLILKTTLQLIFLLAGIFFIAEFIGFSSEFTNFAYDEFMNGIHVMNMTFYPTRILTALIVFCLIYLLSRAISTRLSKKETIHDDDEEETQVVIASILIYIGFGIALIAGLLVAGFNFTGLAIVAGALSVGIGLGLQSIVNNFVSGLILLIEKPLKPGDRISVDGVEGFVKKIQVRSTQIITPSREDIIIPNSDLITRRVTNFMYSDKFCRIKCEIGVAYGSDTILVRDTLVEIASAHDEVIKTVRNKPNVLFQAFGDSNLIFELSCLIKDVNKKSMVRSELNFEIERVFRERNIQMAYPQQDINLRVKSID